MSADLRWEWRTFGDAFDVVKRRVDRIPSKTHESTDTYVVSSLTDANTKIRNSILDIKLLQQIDQHGLELWRPSLKADFPITPRTVQIALGCWGLPKPVPERGTWTLEAFLEQFVSPEAALTVAVVEKRRRTYDLDGCLVELTELVVNGQPLRTAAVEMTDASRVWHIVETLGLSHEKNVNYVDALKTYLGVHRHPT